MHPISFAKNAFFIKMNKKYEKIKNKRMYCKLKNKISQDRNFHQISICAINKYIYSMVIKNLHNIAISANSWRGGG